jgi:integrase
LTRGTLRCPWPRRDEWAKRPVRQSIVSLPVPRGNTARLAVTRSTARRAIKPIIYDIDIRNPAGYFLASKFEMRNAAVPVLDRRDAVIATLRGSRRKATYRTLIDLLALTDMRIGEAIGLNRNDFDANCGVLTIRNGKFGKSRELPLHRVRSPLISREMEVGLRSSRTRNTVPSSGLLLWVQAIRRQWHDLPPHRPRVRGHCLPRNLGESGYEPISCTGGGSLSIWLRSSPRCWRGAKGQEKS